MAMQVKNVLTRRSRTIVLSVLIVVGVYLLAVTPVRTYIDQRHQQQQAEQQYKLLASTNKQLSDRVNQLGTDQEIARLARDQYELVSPGQQAYAVMPPQGATDPAPKPKKKEGFWDHVGDAWPF